MNDKDKIATLKAEVATLRQQFIAYRANEALRRRDWEERLSELERRQKLPRRKGASGQLQ